VLKRTLLLSLLSTNSKPNGSLKKCKLFMSSLIKSEGPGLDATPYGIDQRSFVASVNVSIEVLWSTYPNSKDTFLMSLLFSPYGMFLGSMVRILSNSDLTNE
jgi:hypothetical protein